MWNLGYWDTGFMILKLNLELIKLRYWPFEIWMSALWNLRYRPPYTPLSIYALLSGHMSLESRLIDHLLSNYSSDGRPVSNASEAVSVSIGMYLSKLLDLVRHFHNPAQSFVSVGGGRQNINSVILRGIVWENQAVWGVGVKCHVAFLHNFYVVWWMNHHISRKSCLDIPYTASY